MLPGFYSTSAKGQLLSVLIGFILMKSFGITANILSLGGIALAIGDVVDPGIVMAENAYRMLTNKVLNIENR